MTVDRQPWERSFGRIRLKANDKRIAGPVLDHKTTADVAPGATVLNVHADVVDGHLAAVMVIECDFDLFTVAVIDTRFRSVCGQVLPATQVLCPHPTRFAGALGYDACP